MAKYMAKFVSACTIFLCNPQILRHSPGMNEVQGLDAGKNWRPFLNPALLEDGGFFSKPNPPRLESPH